MSNTPPREGSLEAPKRAPIEWQEPEYYDPASLEQELERVFDICHGCRRCVSLCQSFPTLFDLVDESDTMEVDGVDKADYGKVVDQCFMCDLCAETKCPYLPPHEWAVDFPHLMLRAKAQKFRAGQSRWRDRLLTSTDAVFNTISQPGVANVVNAVNRSSSARQLIEQTAGIHAEAPLPTFHARTARRRIGDRTGDSLTPVPTEGNRPTTGNVALFVTCYGNYNEPHLLEDLIAVLNHNGISTSVLNSEACCGMPKLELGDLEAVARQKDRNLAPMLDAIDAGQDILALVPSCVLMFKQELPLMFADDERVARVRDAIFDPFEYLFLRHRAGELRTDFRHHLGKVAYHAACHQRVQNFGQRTRDVLALVPETEVTVIDRCSGHDGTYAVRSETYEHAMKIARPVVRGVKESEADHYGSDCPMAGRIIEHGLTKQGVDAGRLGHPISLLRHAYGL